MSTVKVTIGNKDYRIERGTTLFQLIERQLPNAKYQMVAARKVPEDEIWELHQPPEENMRLEWISAASEEGLKIIRHSAAHVMAAAVKKLFPGTKITIGPAIENGFYYDFDSEHRFNEEDFPLIEREMQQMIDEDQIFQKSSISKEDALARFRAEKEGYKVELIEDLEDGTITLYRNGEFTDLCRGPHVPTTKHIRAFKLMKISGAYWRGDEKNKMLQRVYGTAFADGKALKQHIRMIEEAKERDHRKIGKEMNLFGFYNEGPGFPFWKPNGMVLYNTIVEYWRKEHREAGYLEVKTPIMLNVNLWHRSGHWDNYKENMYFTEIDKEEYAIKPMNCPGGLLIYNDGIHSYRELPMRVAELGLVHRHEKSGVLHGLMRVREFTQDDAHIYCTRGQVEEEVRNVIRLIQKVYAKFGFDRVNLELSTRPEKSIGSDEIWDLAENSLKKSLESLGLEYKVNPGDGAFYGPKIDFHIKDAIGRSWQCGTIQCDFALPERFDISYIGSDGQKHRPVMLHRTVLGSIERFIGILVENYKGKFPFWLAPEQIRILTIASIHRDFAIEQKNLLQKYDFRVTIDDSEEKLGSKIKQARLERVSYLIIIGDNEVTKRAANVRKADDNATSEIAFDSLVKYFQERSE